MCVVQAVVSLTLVVRRLRIEASTGPSIFEMRFDRILELKPRPYYRQNSGSRRVRWVHAIYIYNTDGVLPWRRQLRYIGRRLRYTAWEYVTGVLFAAFGSEPRVNNVYYKIYIDIYIIHEVPGITSRFQNSPDNILSSTTSISLSTFRTYVQRHMPPLFRIKDHHPYLALFLSFPYQPRLRLYSLKGACS